MTSPLTTSVFHQTLRRRLEEGRQKASRRHKPVLVSVATPMPKYGDLVALFAGAAHLDSYRVFWRQPAKNLCMVGAGTALVIELEGEARFQQAVLAHQEALEDAIIDGPDGAGIGPLFFAGFSFDPQRPRSPAWEGYPDGLLTLPRFLFLESGDQWWLTVNVVVDAKREPGQLVDSIETQLETLQLPVEQACNPAAELLDPEESRAQYKTAVAQAVEAIGNNQLTKVVLARELRLRSNIPLSPQVPLRRLMVSHPDCMVFAIGAGDRCFLGATPEVLVSVRHGRMYTTCLASTIARGSTPQGDALLGESLLSSEKERWEHSVALDQMIESLRGLCRDLEWHNPPELRKLQAVQHLSTSITGQIDRECHVLDVVSALHPTASVGGAPTQAALKAIRELEETDRGWYAGPIGWVDRHGEGEFGVAIRSGLVRGLEARLYAGAGIVAASQPESELVETGLKLAPMLSALGEGS